jgi:transcriptional regulator with XRE-family HTH domain
MGEELGVPGRDSHLIHGRRRLARGRRAEISTDEEISARRNFKPRRFPEYNPSVMGTEVESARLLELLQEKVRLSRRSHRDLEREMGLGHGTIGKLFRGRTELRLRHLAMLGRALGFDPVELLLEAYGVYRPYPPPPPGLGLTREELRAVVQEAVRDEMDRHRR